MTHSAPPGHAVKVQWQRVTVNTYYSFPWYATRLNFKRSPSDPVAQSGGWGENFTRAEGRVDRQELKRDSPPKCNGPASEGEKW